MSKKDSSKKTTSTKAAAAKKQEAAKDVATTAEAAADAAQTTAAANANAAAAPAKGTGAENAYRVEVVTSMFIHEERLQPKGAQLTLTKDQLRRAGSAVKVLK